MYTYAGFGMKIISEIPLRLPRVLHETHEVHVRTGTVSNYIPDPYQTGAITYGSGIESGTVLISIPGYARMRIEGDSQVCVDPEKGVDPLMLSSCITGIALLVVLKNQPVITMHGSAVVKEDRAYGFIGNQGSGKSTTAAALSRHGFSVLCDDVVPILPGNPYPSAVPGIPVPKLLPDALRFFGGDPEASEHLFDGIDKYHVSVSGSRDPAPLHGLFILEPSEACTMAEAHPIRGIGKLKEIFRHVSVLRGLEESQEIFTRVSTACSMLPVWKISRPAEAHTLDQIAELIQACMGEAD